MAKKMEDEDDGDLVGPLSGNHLDHVCSESHVPRVSGLLSNKYLGAGPVARARKANLSVMMLIQRSRAAARTGFSLSEATATITAATLVDI